MTAEPGPRYESRLGTLTDEDISAMVGDGRLITKDFAAESIKQACYELRASDIYYRPPDRDPLRVKDGDSIIVRPKELIVILVKERVELPANMLGRILTKGQLFSLGLSSVNTYADPGFEGRLGIVFYNASTHYISIAPGTPIAKMEFTQLERPVAKPYDGQHGYQTELWPMKTEHYYLKDEDVVRLRREGKLESALAAIERAFGRDFAKIATSLIRSLRSLFLSMTLYLVCTITLIFLSVGDVLKNVVVNLALGVVSSIIASVFVIMATSRR